MDSEDSDDEPLSVIALKKRGDLEIEISPIFEPQSYSIQEKSHKKECEVLIALQPKFEKEPPVVKRPADVWLYLTDLNPTGPYNCLLCSEWFINRTRIVIHYVVNHKKDYCGICRYFVPNRDAWWEHVKFHMPWRCSQCEDSFASQMEWRVHFSNVHQLVHCRLCYLRLPDDEEYHTHLYKSHCVTNSASAYKEVIWDFECEGTQKFLCLLCSKSCSVGRQFADHYMAYHHLTLKCFMFLVSGIDLPFSFKGIDLSPEFVETELKSFDTLGYVNFVKKLKVEQEPAAIFEEVPITVDCDPAIKECNESNDDEDVKPGKEIKYKGEVDFDVTLMELILLEKCYFKYVSMTLDEINANVMPISSEISYVKDESCSKSINCCLCKDEFLTNDLFETHMTKVHSVKSVPIYWCRVCAAAFDNLSELETHCSQELGDFDDLWICQFCEKEFDNREETRKHLTEHWDAIDYDNCFSPHLGFKCKFCPILFWNETDRETHHVRVHSLKRLSDFYKCTSCGEVFGDKIFFVHHYIDRHNSNNATYLLKCCICSIVLQNVEDMRSHFDVDHPDNKKMFCSLEQCKYKPFRQKKSLVLHVKTVHYPSSRPRRSTTCNTCGLSFNSAKARTAHTVQVHGPGKYKCTICHEFLRTIDERKLHYLIRHPGRFQYQCDACDKSFQYKSSLYMHKQEHTPNKKDYPCTYCGKVFLKKDSYREHIMIHEAPRHACSYCPMRFVQRSNMLRHERRHTGERPYSCKMCPRTFSDKGACTSHSRTHLKTTSYTCMYCGQTFAQKSKLTYHIRKHTGENLETCSLCSKIFTSACSLREHMRVHQRKKMKKIIKCPLCKNMYPDEREMLRHVRAAHTGARWRCPLCRKTVCSASSLREHVLTHSREHVYRCNVCPKAYHSKKSIIKHLQLRHGLKRHEISPKTSYRHLDPKECNLGLDDDVLEKIFGNFRRKPNTDVLLGDFVTFNKNLKLTSYSQQNTSTQPNIAESVSEEESAREEDVQVKIEPVPIYEDEEVPSPDFVNVKIECVNIDYDQQPNTEMP